MNLPNKLTVARIIATPIFLLFMELDFAGHYFVAMLIFIAASLTDMLDGQIARKKGLVTDFGKFLDPVADKMLTTAAFLAFLRLGVGSGILWIVFLVLFREFLITSLRLVVVSSGGKVIAANLWGKAKTVSQMTAIIFTLFALSINTYIAGTVFEPVVSFAVSAMLWISTVLCVISGVIYLIQNGEFINSSK